MQHDYRNNVKEDLVREVEELEDAYAEAFAEGVDEWSLTTVWDKIKSLRGAIEVRRNGDDGRSLSRQEV
jgi:hypothetical protein